MARVPLIEETEHPELAESIAKIKGARGGRLINIYRLMLHSPALANAWFDLNQAVRYGTEIDGQSRELAVIRVAISEQRRIRPARPWTGVRVKRRVDAGTSRGLGGLATLEIVQRPQRALLAYTDAMTSEIDVADSVFSELRQHFSERQTVELTMLIGAYNMLTRFLKALKVDPEP